MKAWLSQLRQDIGFAPASPVALAAFELENALPGAGLRN